MSSFEFIIVLIVCLPSIALMITGIALLVMDRKRNQALIEPEPEPRIRCSYCAELVEPGTTVCRFCGHEIQPSTSEE